ncbi:MAG TPA: hypothetical protein VLB49_12265, partial [Gemmatimonadales bacterium]|nr:hypothetical protein [Gemmatimonadales bacterium]
MPSRSMLQRLALATVVLTIWHAPLLAAQATLADLRDLTPREHRSAAFVLTSPQLLQIEATGAEPRLERGKDAWQGGDNEDSTTWPAAAWIVDVRTRAVVWDLRTAATVRSSEGLHRFSGTVRLPAGVYEVHFASYVASSVSYSGSFRNLISLRRDRRNNRVRYGGPYVDDGSYRKLGIVVRGPGRVATGHDVDSASRPLTGEVVLTLRADTPGVSERAAFEVTRAIALEAHAVGELRKDGAFDYGWIQSADTRRRVWEMEYGQTVEAGGARKNRTVRDTIHLPAGRYVAYFVSDDSHDPEEWNAVPPFDPGAWGLTLRVIDPAARAAIRQIAWDQVPDQTIVSLIRIGNDELRTAGFTLRRPLEVRVYALGEGSDPNGEMSDYAWIVNAATRRRVWAMRYDDTEAAGGADKNRLYDRTLRLEAGSYLVYYRSDGSHSFDDWNAAPPPESRYWGVSVFPASGRLDSSIVAPFRRVASGALVEIVQVKNDRHKREMFTLDRPTALRVYALGEASGEEMADYGWIEDAANGATV